jgi:hypothetical protein
MRAHCDCSLTKAMGTFWTHMLMERIYHHSPGGSRAPMPAIALHDHLQEQALSYCAALWSQCGGRSCHQSSAPCEDAPWVNVTCRAGATCVRSNEWCALLWYQHHECSAACMLFVPAGLCILPLTRKYSHQCSHHSGRTFHSQVVAYAGSGSVYQEQIPLQVGQLQRGDASCMGRVQNAGSKHSVLRTPPMWMTWHHA